MQDGEARVDRGVMGNARSAIASDFEDGIKGRGRLGRLSDLRPFSRTRRVTLHRAAGVEGPAESIGYHRTMLVIRALGAPLMVALAPLYARVDVLALGASAAVLLAILAIQLIWLRGDPTTLRLRHLAILGVAGDSLAAYLVAQAFVANAEWVAYLAYQIVALEAAVFLGLRAAMLSIAVSLVVFAVQMLQRQALGFPVTAGHMLTIAAIFAIQATVVGAFARISRRVRDDLATLLRLSALLAHQESPTRIVQALDSRLREIVGARVRSVALRRPDGGYDILRWRSPDVRTIGPEAVGAVSRLVGRDIEADFHDRRAVTLLIEPGRDGPIVEALGLPTWVRALSMVPIHSDGAHTGILPVLWDHHRVPSDGELDLLHGLADQTGLAFGQAQLRRARELAATDSLTGLANHRAFQDLLAGHLRDVRARGGRLAILFCDLDRFKAVNDRHGHAVGDLLLHRIATAVRTAAREGDIVARYGGDELALILPGTDLGAALEVGRRLREEVRSVENGMGVDMTVGVAVYPDHAERQDALIARADAAMYAGKRLGGGRIVHAAEIGGEA
jgi:diguanylate cyclase (GGDEF)-like protein